MGGGGGSSGKISYPTHMTTSHEQLLNTMEGYVSSVPDPKYWTAVAYDPQTDNEAMLANMIIFNNNMSTYAPTLALAYTNMSAVEFTYDKVKANYLMDMFTEATLNFDSWSAEDEAMPVPTVTTITVDSWTPLTDGVPTAWEDGVTDPLSNVSLQGYFNAMYNAAMARRTFEEQTALKGKARNLGTIATSNFAAALLFIEKMAIAEATAATAELIKHQMSLLESRGLNKNEYKTKVAAAHRELRKLQADVQLTAVQANKTQNEAQIAVGDYRLRKRSIKKDVINSGNEIKVRVHQANLEVAKFWETLERNSANIAQAQAEANTKITSLNNQMALQIWSGANNLRMEMLRHSDALVRAGVLVRSAVISSNVEELESNLEYDFVAREWVFKKLGFWGQALSAMGGGGTGQGLQKPNKTKSAMTGALSGASIGASTGNPYAAGIGAVVGGLSGYFGA